MNAQEKVAYILGTQIGDDKQENKEVGKSMPKPNEINRKIAKAARLIGDVLKDREAQNEAMKHPDKLGAGAKKREKLHSKDDKFAAVMREFERGTLHDSSGKIVTDRKKAQAIAYSESGKD